MPILGDLQQSATVWTNIQPFVECEDSAANRFDATLRGGCRRHSLVFLRLHHTGASAFSLGQSATIDANEKRSCDLARMARDAFNLASINLPAGGQKYPTEAAQLLTAIPQFTPAVDNEIKRFCK